LEHKVKKSLKSQFNRPAQSVYNTIIITINKPKAYCFGIDCHVFHSSSI